MHTHSCVDGHGMCVAWALQDPYAAFRAPAPLTQKNNKQQVTGVSGPHKRAGEALAAWNSQAVSKAEHCAPALQNHAWMQVFFSPLQLFTTQQGPLTT